MENIRRWQQWNRFGAVLFACLLGQSHPVVADQQCTWQTLDSPTRQIVTCGDRVTFEREAGTTVVIRERARDAAPSEIELENGAILIEVAPGSRPTQIRTPHAIAAVRGTTYVVDAGETATSVFVVEGEVAVGKPGETARVTLSAGEGVDVTVETPLAVALWPEARAAALLARFGR